MRSWLFRNRLRLRAIYGPRPAPLAAGDEASQGAGPRKRAAARAHTTVERQGRRIVLRTRA